MSNQTEVIKPKRRTLDSILGINGLLIAAILGTTLFKGGILDPIGMVCGLSALYYLIKRRKELTKKQKYIGWGLMVLHWLLIGVMASIVV